MHLSVRVLGGYLIVCVCPTVLGQSLGVRKKTQIFPSMFFLLFMSSENNILYIQRCVILINKIHQLNKEWWGLYIRLFFPCKKFASWLKRQSRWKAPKAFILFLKEIYSFIVPLFIATNELWEGKSFCLNCGDLALLRIQLIKEKSKIYITSKKENKKKSTDAENKSTDAIHSLLLFIRPLWARTTKNTD